MPAISRVRLGYNGGVWVWPRTRCEWIGESLLDACGGLSRLLQRQWVCFSFRLS